MVYRHDNVVVCGVDGSDESFNALVWAAHEAKTRRARLEIVCCYEQPTYAGYRTSGRNLLEENAQTILDDAVARVKPVGIEVTPSLDPADPTAALLNRSKTAARVVIGARGGSGGFADRLLGSVASAVSSRAYCAVVIVPSTPVDTVLPVKHIVCGFDGSESSRLAMALAIREASRWGAKLSCVSAVNFSGSAWIPGSDYHQEVLDDVRASLREAADDAVKGYNVDVRCHAIEGNAAALMTEFSTAVDLLVLGTRGRGGFAGLLLGSTSQSVIQHAACPTIVVPQRTRENEDTNMGSSVPWDRP
ncbi:MAG: universal stress protein [Ancrocorticia sp.]|jgi:nucleotide-binding universal stress UspA family protein|nr:universal stress protein [Ancrocorticia sp.]MCI1896140.1 universal stress protein [Ancrocorticia sp.]MCI1932926.1 universal stress protein [Ancrocorticia sp.]MCI2012511.1 universal stress protein [Ancrocorticia sp.]MCI2029536.1 universal stress protein [Ancrocorticia sp.]